MPAERLLALPPLEVFKTRAPQKRCKQATVRQAYLVTQLAGESRDDSVHVMHFADQDLLVSRFPIARCIAHHDAHTDFDRMVEQLHETAVAGHQVSIADDRRVLGLAG